MNIAYSSSSYYFKPTYVSIFSLLENSCKKHNIILLSDGISKDNISSLKNLVEQHGSTFIYYEIADELKVFAKKFNFPLMRGGYSTYARIFLADILLELDEVLLLDSDTLILGDISEVEDCKKKSIMMACRDYVVSNKYSRHEDQDLAGRSYFNMGVLYINLSAWRNIDLTNVLKQRYEKNYKLKIADQTIINKYLFEYVSELDIRFNFYTYFHYGFTHEYYRNLNNDTEFLKYAELQDATEKPIVLHFVGTWYERPWFKINISPYSDLYRNYWLKCFKVSCYLGIPRLNIRNVLYDISSFAIYKLFGVKMYFNFRYKFIQLLKGFFLAFQISEN